MVRRLLEYGGVCVVVWVVTVILCWYYSHFSHYWDRGSGLIDVHRKIFNLISQMVFTHYLRYISKIRQECMMHMSSSSCSS